jgi:hypothetical protein
MKALYDEGQDYLDSFWPFAVTAIPSRTSVDISFVQRKIKEKYNLEMPLHVIAVILARAERKNYVRKETFKPIKYKLTGAGYNYAVKLENDREVERRTTALLESITKFFKQKNAILNSDQIGELLLYFIHKNIDFLVECINPSISPKTVPPPVLHDHDRLLLEYIQTADNQEPENYKMLENMIMGSIISALLYVEEPEDITKIRQTKFGHCQVFLDTNFVFSVLGLDLEEFNEPAKELFSLLKRNNFELKVFSFTVDEMATVLNSYSRESYRYPTSIKVNSLYSALKNKGWSKTDAREFIINIEQNLRQQGIRIEWIKGINLKSYSVDGALRNGLRKYKPDQNPFGQNHDLASIAIIREMRGKSIRKLEDSKAFFLTSDVKLSRFNLETEHKRTGTICETILDRLFTNILWLKNPNAKPPLKSIIAAHSRDLFVNRRIWEKFYGVLQELKKSGKANDEGISTLFWHSYVEDALKSIEETDSDKITPQFVLEEIEKAGKQKEEDFEKTRKEIEKIEKLGKEKEKDFEKKKKELEETMREMETKFKTREREFLENLESVATEKSRTEREWLEKIQRMKERIRTGAESQANLWTNVLRVSIILTYLALVGLAIFHFNIQIQWLSFLFSVVIGLGGISGIWKFVARVRPRLLSHIYNKQMREAELDKT